MSASSAALTGKTYWCTSFPPTKNVHPSHGPVNFTKTPWPSFLTRLFIVRPGLVILLKDINFVELEERLDLRHHPCQSYVGLTLIRISATNILMYTREPILKHISQSGRFRIPAAVTHTCLKLVVLLRGFAHTLGCKTTTLTAASPYSYRASYRKGGTMFIQRQCLKSVEDTVVQVRIVE